ncbi:MAG: hypothetical protein R2940_07575 [Syntrophotaleaceae bacterium]
MKLTGRAISGGRFRRLSFPLIFLLLAGCYMISGNQGGGAAEFSPPRKVDTSDVLLPEGYEIEVVARGLTFPAGIAFDGEGVPYVIEAGYSYGEVFRPARLLRLKPDGSFDVIAQDEGNVPWTGLSWHEGAFYVAANGQKNPDGGKILRIENDGRISVVVDGLPGHGDHQTNGPNIGPDGYLYFLQGTATNSGVVGLDNWEMGWLRRFPDYHDKACQDIVLRGENFVTKKPQGMKGEMLDKDTEELVTGAFVPYGTPTTEGQVIPGEFPCSGAIMRVRPEGGKPNLVAWGFRNPFWLAFSPDGRLFATENGYDVRGSRPVFGSGDFLWEVRPGLWYGWPDFQGGRPLEDWNRLSPFSKDPLRPLLAEYPNTPPSPTAVFAVHSSANGFDFSRNSDFGRKGKAFVAQFGDITPMSGKLLAPTGFRVVEVDVETGVVHDFAVNAGPVGGPASWGDTEGLERPVAVRFDPDGRALYLVDFGVLTVTDKGMTPFPETGVIWRIRRKEG